MLTNHPGLDAGVPVDPATDINENEVAIAAIRMFIQRRIADADEKGEPGTPELAVRLNRELAAELTNYVGFVMKDVLHINYQLTQFFVYITDPEGVEYRVE